LVTIDSSKATDKINFDFGKFNKISIAENITSNGYFIISFEKASVFVGENASYKLYTSEDKQNWELVEEVQPLSSGSKNIRLQFNSNIKFDCVATIKKVYTIPYMTIICLNLKLVLSYHVFQKRFLCLFVLNLAFLT